MTSVRTSVVQQVISPIVSQAYQNGLDQTQGFVVNAADVVGARTAADVIDAFGATLAAPSLTNPDGSVDVLRMPTTAFLRTSTPYGPDFAKPGNDIAFIEPAPFTGNGFTATRNGIIPQWYIERARLPAGSELWRIGPNGGEQFIDAYRDVGLGWGSSRGIPSHLLGPKASLEEQEFLADVIDGGHAVALAHLGQQPPPGFEPVRPWVSRRVVAAEEVDKLVETVLTCTWQGEPFQVINTGNSGVSMTYTGRDYRVAERLRLSYAQPAVYETTVPRDQIADVGGFTQELPVAGQTGHDKGPTD